MCGRRKRKAPAHLGQGKVWGRLDPQRTEVSLALLLDTLNGHTDESTHDCADTLVGEVCAGRHFLNQLGDGEQASRLSLQVSNDALGNTLVCDLLRGWYYGNGTRPKLGRGLCKRCRV